MSFPFPCSCEMPLFGYEESWAPLQDHEDTVPGSDPLIKAMELCHFPKENPFYMFYFVYQISSDLNSDISLKGRIAKQLQPSHKSAHIILFA